MNDYYTAGEHVDKALKLHHRVYSTMGNPNLLAQFAGWNLVGFTMAFLYNVGSKFRNLGVVFACLVTLVIASSRYGLLAAILGFVLILMTTTPNRRRRVAQIGLLVLLLPIFAWIFASFEMKNQSIAERFGELKHPTEIGSLRDRVDKLWLEAGDYITKSPILGHGPAKEIFTGVYTDSEYLNILKEFGIVGFMPYIALYLFPLYLMWKGLQAGQRAGPLLENRFAATHLILCWGFVMVVTSLFMNIGEFTYFNDMLQGYLWMWFGLGAGAAKTIVDATGYGRPRVRVQSRGRTFYATQTVAIEAPAPQ